MTHDVTNSPITLAVGGMTCAGCASTIQRGLAQLPGVDDAFVNVATRRATITPDGTLDPAELDSMMRAAINGLGYQVLTKELHTAEHADSATPSSHADSPTPSSHRDSATPSSHLGSGQHQHAALADEHAEHLHADASRVADYRQRFIVGLILTLPLLLISMVPVWQFEGWEWVAAALATPVFLYSGWPFHRSTIKGLRHGAVNMDTLVTLGTTAAWLWSMVVLIGHAVAAPGFADAHVYFETGAVIVTLIVLGKWLEVRSTATAGDAIRALSSRQSSTARLEDGTEIARDQLEVGMRFLTRPGEAIATDGIVVDGSAAIDASLVTGESVPVPASPGDEVIGGTIATDGALTIEATRVGDETMLAQVARMVDDALSSKARIQRLADRISSWFVPVVMVLALATLIGWLAVTGDVNDAFTAAVAVLIISCPCALGLATPLALLVGTGRAAQQGILVRGPQVFEDTRRLGVVVLDKTGTVTEGRMSVAGQYGPEPILDAAAAVEARSEHPIAQAIATTRGSQMLIKGFRSVPGQGVTATVQGAGSSSQDADVAVGSRRMFDEIPEAIEAWASEREAHGQTVVFAGRTPVLGNGLLGNPATTLSETTRASVIAEAAIAVHDTVKPTSHAAVASFKDLGLDVVLLTGDNARAAQAVADELGIDRVIAEVLPSDKARIVAELQADGTRVAMIGDGVNDAPALAQADLGIAIGTGADVAREASDLTLVSGDPRAAADAIALSRRTLRTIRGNLFWAFAYNVAAIPLAAFGILNPMIAAATMGGSSLFVVGNSLRLRRFRGHRS